MLVRRQFWGVSSLSPSLHGLWVSSCNPLSHFISPSLINLKCFIFPNVPGLLSLTGVNNTVYGIDAMNPSSRDDFTEFGKLLKDKITQYEKSLYYASFLEALVRDVCISLEIDDLKKITNSLTVLCSEKQKQEKVRKARSETGLCVLFWDSQNAVGHAFDLWVLAMTVKCPLQIKIHEFNSSFLAKQSQKEEERRGSWRGIKGHHERRPGRLWWIWRRLCTRLWRLHVTLYLLLSSFFAHNPFNM